MATDPQGSLPQRCGRWSDLKAAYRFFSNERVDPHQIGAVHREQTRRHIPGRCAHEPVVLCVQDGTDFQAARVPGDRYIQHSTLAVSGGEVPEIFGLVDQRWYERVDTPAGETRKARAARWRESDVWIDAAKAVGPAPAGTRLIHVADRAADDLRFMGACVDQDAGFILRARHDRNVGGDAGGDSGGGGEKLWSCLQGESSCGELTVTIGTQRDCRGRITRRGREAKVAVRFANVHLNAPLNHPGAGGARVVRAVYLREIDPPDDASGVEWMLLTSEAVSCFDDAARVIGYYQRRWVIEEWHRALKEGCRLERSQLDDVASLQRLAAVLSVVAVRLLQLRDLADAQHSGASADDADALAQTTPRVWIEVVAGLAQAQADALTPKQFWRTIALQGGWIGRTRDGRPGWKTLWQGWSVIAQMVRGVELIRKTHNAKGCG